MQNVFPWRVERIPVVKLLDCCYIKALLKSTSVKTYKVDCGSLHVALGEGKIVSSSRSMGQNDLSSSHSIVQARRSLPQKNILVEKVMCQNKNSKCQNGKQLSESKRCLDLKKQSKRIKMSKDAEKPVHTNNECELQREDTATADSSTILKKLNCSETTSLSLLDHTHDFILEQPLQKPQYQLANLSSNEKVSEAHLDKYSTSGFEKSEVFKKHVLELKSIEAQIGIGNEVGSNNSIAKTLFSEKITSCNKNITDCMKRGETTPKGKTVGEVGRKLQLNTCQRAVPISGKNVWLRGSCARTSLWVHKNHVSDLERDFLRTTDSVVNSGQMELYKPLTGTTKDFPDNLMDHTTKRNNQSPTSESLFYVCKSPSAIGNEDKFSSTDVEISKKYTSSNKIVKKSKMASRSLVKVVKNKGNITKRAISIDTQSGAFADNRKSKRNYQKTSVGKQELVLKTLITGNSSNFRIPLLKDKNESRKGEYARSSERDSCNPLDILEDSNASVKKARAKEISSYVNSKHHSQFEQINGITILEEYADQLESDVPDKVSKDKSVHNKDMGASHVNELELPTLKGSPGFLSTGFIKKQMLDSSLATETNDEGNCSNNCTEDKANYFADVLKAYEDDVLMIDVIEDDPDLFGDTDEQEPANINSSIFLKKNLELEPESPYLPRSQLLKCYPRDDPIHDHGTLKSVTDAKISLTEVGEIKSESLSGISSIGGVTESSLEDGQLTETDDLAKNFNIDKKYNFSEKMLAVKEEKTNVQGIAKIKSAQYIDPLNRDHQLKLLLPANKATAPQQQDIAVKPWINDFRFPKKGPLLPSSYSNGYESWKVDKNAMTNLGLTYLPYGYCRSYFNTLNGCERANCWYSHFLASGNDKLCSKILEKYISIGEVGLLKRAVQIFTDYYKEGIPAVHLDSQIINNLLTSLLQSCLLKELFHVVHTSILVKILPTEDILLKVFEHVASMKLRDVVPELIDISYKLVDAGMVLEYEHVDYITKLLNLLQVSSQKINTFLSKFQGRHFHKNSLCDLESAAAEFQHCKEKGDWAKLGTLYINVRRGCENVGDLEKYSLCIANILASSTKAETPGIPFCEFATAVYADSHHNEADTTLLGRIGISVMFSYYKMQQWSKAKKVLDLLHALKIHFTFSKGLLGPDRVAPRCHIVNVAVEIFLKCGSLAGAIWVLRESEWVINTLSWPCDRMDVVKRHNLLCTIASEYITKRRYGEAFEVLQNLPGFQNSCDTLDVSQYSLLFNKLLGACLESKNLGTSSAVAEFMFAKNIPVEFNLLSALITALGRSCLWLKARTHYKSALALGCYPPLEGNLYRKLLVIPSYMSEVEMLLAIEIFLVSNASSVQSPGASSQILQIVLKRCEGNSVRNEDDYQSAVERLIQAAHISSPMLFIKHLAVNVNMEQVYSLENACVLKWLKQNMKWAGKVWLF